RLIGRVVLRWDLTERSMFPMMFEAESTASSIQATLLEGQPHLLHVRASPRRRGRLLLPRLDRLRVRTQMQAPLPTQQWPFPPGQRERWLPWGIASITAKWQEPLVSAATAKAGRDRL